MTREEKQLLLVDLCARLPYGVKVYYQKLELPFTLFEVNLKGEVLTLTDDIQTNYFVQYVQNSKPYLRPISSMTEKEKKEWYGVIWKSQECSIENSETSTTYVSDWLLEHHFDVHGLIKRGLALEAPKEMYNI